MGTYSAGSTTLNCPVSASKALKVLSAVSPAKSPPTGWLLTKSPSTKVDHPPSTSSNRSHTIEDSCRNTESDTRVYNEESEGDLYSTERCEERKSATSDPGVSREERVKRPWYVSWDWLLSRNDLIEIAGMNSHKYHTFVVPITTYHPRFSVDLRPSNYPTYWKIQLGMIQQPPPIVPWWYGPHQLSN